MKRVFVTQRRSALDLDHLRSYGEPIFLTPDRFQVYESVAAPTEEFQQNMSTFCDDDFILLIGDPVLIGLATMVASNINNGRVALLKWDRIAESYHVIRLDLKGRVANDE